ncbi:MAG: 4-(cytidine 5'-diphospho)-2-C-methyl-D-erythritol kinase [Desulfobacteraceae bacterium]|nr:4-(cytidine 5'-diphospho)-2-C-methyl-D-erythritol kinase [Desulfobacteraceae bacterium]
MHNPGIQRINVSTSQRIIELLAPAKINLCLHVIGRRPDGYHELFSLMCCVAIFDRLVIRMGTVQSVMTCDEPSLPCDDSNLVLKAARLFNKHLGEETRISPDNLSIHLHKRIPMGAGLGGGSSDAAAVLLGLNGYYGEPFDRQRLRSLALQLGADVPFFIDGRPAIAQGIGEQLSPYTGLPAYGLVLIYPGFGLATAQVYKNLNFALTKSKKKLRNVPFKNGDFHPSHHLHNDLEAGVGDHFTVIEKLKKDLLNQGAIGSLMTGSGSAVFGLFDSEEGAQAAKAAMVPSPSWQMFVTRLIV